MEAQPERRYAGWGQRFGALVIDLLIAVLAPTLVLGFIGLTVVGYDDNPNTDDSSAWGALGGLIFFPLSLIYFWLFNGGRRGQTPGKRQLGIAVRRAENLDSVGYGRAAGRTAVFAAGFALSPLFLVDNFWPLWDERRQALHDKVSGSVVVRVR